MQKFLELLNEILNCETPVGSDNALNAIEEWDSLAFVSFLAMAYNEYGKQLKAADLKNAQTVEDLYNLVCKE